MGAGNVRMDWLRARGRAGRGRPRGPLPEGLSGWGTLCSTGGSGGGSSGWAQGDSRQLGFGVRPAPSLERWVEGGRRRSQPSLQLKPLSHRVPSLNAARDNALLLCLQMQAPLALRDFCGPCAVVPSFHPYSHGEHQRYWKSLVILPPHLAAESTVSRDSSLLRVTQTGRVGTQMCTRPPESCGSSLSPTPQTCPHKHAVLNIYPRNLRHAVDLPQAGRCFFQR